MFVNAFKDGDTYVIHIANTTAKTVTLKNIIINEKTINTESTEADYYFVEGSSIKASYGKSRFEDNPVDQISTLEGSGMLNTLLLPGFSVG